MDKKFKLASRPHWSRRSIATPESQNNSSSKSSTSLDSIVPVPKPPPSVSTSVTTQPPPPPANRISESFLVDLIVRRISQRLPAHLNSSTEPDLILSQASNSLLELSRRHLHLVIPSILNQLDALTKPPYFNPETDYVSVDLLRSQFILLRLLSMATIYYWYSSDTPERRSKRPPAIPGAPPSFLDPLPLDDTTAHHLLSLCLSIFRQHSQPDDPSSRVSTAQSIQSALNALANNLHPPFPQIPTTRSAVIAQLVKTAMRIVYFLSASNWNILFGRVKTRVALLATTQNTAMEEDMTEVRLLEWSCLDRRRIASVIQEINGTFVHLRKQAQSSISQILRLALWTTIESFPAEFASFTNSGRRHEGGPEILFDVVYNQSETGVGNSSSKRKASWGVLGMLLVFCPDIVGKLAVGESTRSVALSKKKLFVEGLKKNLRSSSLNDVGVSVYLDLLRAATFTEPDPTDLTALQMLIEDLDYNLADALLDPYKSSLSESGPDIKLMSSALISLFRLRPSNTSRTLFPSLLHPDSSIVCKLTATSAILGIVEDGKLLPWTPAVHGLLEHVGHSLRSVLGSISDSTSHTRAYSVGAAEENSDRNKLVRSILSIWTADMRFLIYPATHPSSASRYTEDLFLPITRLLDESNFAGVRKLASECLSALLDGFPNGTLGFEKAAVDVIYDLCKYVTQCKFDPVEEGSALKVLIKALVRIQDLLAKENFEASLIVDKFKAPGVLTILEIALLTCLTSCETENRVLAMAGFVKVEAIVIRLSVLDGSPFTLSPVVKLIAGLEGEYDEETAGPAPSTSSLALPIQPNFSATRPRRAYDVLRSLKEPTLGLAAAWDEGTRRWKELSAIIFLRLSDEDSETGSVMTRREQIESMKTPEQQFEEWSNLCGFLLASGGGCDSKRTLGSLEKVVRAEYLGSRFYRPLDRGKNIDRLVQELNDLIVSDVPKIRLAVKEAFGNDLHPSQFLTYFSQLKSIISHFVSTEKGVKMTEEAFTVFIEQVITVLYLVFKRIKSEEPVPSNVGVVLDGLIGSFTLYVQRLGFSGTAFKLKIRLCELCALVLGKREHPAGKGDSNFRNNVLEHFVSWASDSQPTNTDEGQDKLRKELDEACLRAMVPLLADLVVHTPDPTITVDNPPVTNPRLFSRYYDFFIFTIHRYSVGNSTSSKFNPSATYRPRYMKDNNSPKHCAVAALANLINANPNPAYLHLAELGASRDAAARATYLEALTLVTEKNTIFKSTSLPPEKDSFQDWLSLLRQPDLTLIMALCEVCSTGQLDDLTEVCLKIFDTPRSIVKFIKASIEMEVAVTDHESTLFRGNSFATRILTAYSRAKGYTYLRSTLKDLLETICKKPTNFSMEWSFERPTMADDLASRNLEQVTEAFLVCISESVENVPVVIREICQHIAEVVGDRFPESVYTAVGGFIFLRFINPAIVSPETIDLDLSVDNREIRRGLVMITKVLQALSNNVRFGAKEPGLKKLNAFMENNIYTMTRFLQQVSMSNHVEDFTDQLLDDPTADATEDNLDESDRTFLHNLISDNMDKLGMILLQNQPLPRRWRDGNEDISPTIGTKTWEKLTTIMAEQGISYDSKDRMIINSWGDDPVAAYEAFMLRNKTRLMNDASLWKHVFYQVDKEHNRSFSQTFVLLLNRIKASTADIESLIYHIFKHLGTMKTNYDILIDCTKFLTTNEPPVTSVLQVISLLPVSSVSYLQRVIIFSPNSVIRQYLRKLGRLTQFDRFDSRRILAISSILELETHFSSIEKVLPPFTISLNREKRIAFGQITERPQTRVEHPVVVKIGASTLVVSTIKKLDLLADVKCGLNDVFDLADIDEIRTVSAGPDAGAFYFRITGEKTVRRFFANSKREELFSTLSTAKGEAPVKGVTQDPYLELEDSTGVMINIVLFNLCSSEERLRSMGYELLCSLTQANGISGFEDPKEGTAAHVPYGNLTFLCAVSERLATALPSHSLGFFSQFASVVEFMKPGESAAFVHCLKPWLHNLLSLLHTSRERRDAVYGKLRRAFRKLITFSAKEPAFHMTLVSRIWPTIGKIDFLLELLLDECIRALTAFEVGTDGDPCATVSQILVALAAGSLLRGKVLWRIRNLLGQTSHKNISSLASSAEWPEIVALIRLDVPLAFESRIQAQMYFGDLLYIFVGIVASGPLPARLALHAMVLNTLQSLSKDPNADQAKMGVILRRIEGEDAQILFDLRESSEYQEPWEMSGAAEDLIKLFSQVISAAAPTTDMENVWRARWLGLATACCFHYNPVLQPRAFLTLALAGKTEIDTDLMFQMITSLKVAVTATNSKENSLAVNVVRAISCALPGIKSIKAGLWSSLFWMAVSLIQICNPKLTGAALGLMTVSLDGLTRLDLLGGKGFIEVLLKMRDDEDDKVAFPQQIDQIIGVNFRTGFSFAFTTILAKALKHSMYSKNTVELLLMLMRNSVQDELESNRKTGQKFTHLSFGFFVLLLPTMYRLKRLDELLQAAKLDGIVSTRNARLTDILEQVLVHVHLDPETSILSLATLAGLGLVADKDDESVAILTLFGKISDKRPEIAALVYDSLVPTLSQLMGSSENMDVLDAVQMVVQSEGSRQTARGDGTQILTQLGFGALTDKDFAAYSVDELEGFSPFQQEIAHLVAGHVDQILTKPN